MPSHVSKIPQTIPTLSPSSLGAAMMKKKVSSAWSRYALRSSLASHFVVRFFRTGRMLYRLLHETSFRSEPQCQRHHHSQGEEDVEHSYTEEACVVTNARVRPKSTKRSHSYTELRTLANCNFSCFLRIQIANEELFLSTYPKDSAQPHGGFVPMSMQASAQPEVMLGMADVHGPISSDFAPRGCHPGA